jgi:hypothetical protein
MTQGPAVGSWWVHPRYRDAWRVEKVGRKYVYLRGGTPSIPDARVDLVMWPGRWVPRDARDELREQDRQNANLG